MIECPICGNIMHRDGDYYVCGDNTLHKCHIEKEWSRFVSGEKDRRWLAWRMKCRFGKSVHHR